MPFTWNKNNVVPMNDKASGLRSQGEVQEYVTLRDHALQSGQLFEDPEFPAEDSSLYFSKSPPRRMTWLRPPEMTDSPQFISDGASRFDVQQGSLGNCWLLAALANLTLNKSLLNRVVPPDQSFADNYAGIFHFRFWQYGRWVDVVIDDRLPTYNGQLMFLSSKDTNEFWSALLEKAYAKLHGSYEALNGGLTSEGMVDFSGGVSEKFEKTDLSSHFLKVMLKFHERQSMMCCSIMPNPDVTEDVLDNGLVRGHAYSITRVCAVDIETPNVSGKIPMVRVRNPWGNETEWKGAFSDSSPEWKFIPEEERQEIGLSFDSDGEFWMTYNDFCSNFENLEVCNLLPDTDEVAEVQEERAVRFEVCEFEGAWVRGVTAGGCRNHIETFHFNPQYTISLTDPDEDDDEDCCTLIVSLMQKNRRAKRKMGEQSLSIGFAIYHVPEPDSAPKPLDNDFFRYNASVARSSNFVAYREVSGRFKLPPGTYCIVPSTFRPNEEGEFVIRVLTEKKSDMKENDDEIGRGEVDENIRSDVKQECTDKMREIFTKIAGGDFEIDYVELQTILNGALKKELNSDGFSKDTSRSMVALMDLDSSGKLGLMEFLSLWKSLAVWKNSFKQHDMDQSGVLSSFELRRSLKAAGYGTNNSLLNYLMHRYGNRQGEIQFADYIALSVRMQSCLEMFNCHKDDDGRISFSLNEWMHYFMYS